MATVEGALGALVILGVVAGFTLGAPPPTGTGAQLDAYAGDALTILRDEPPRHGGETRLAEVTESARDFQRERGALIDRIERVLPENVMFRIETPHGTAGHPKPSRIATGAATVTTVNGDVTLRVWYA
jgi:hypothetical protein